MEEYQDKLFIDGMKSAAIGITISMLLVFGGRYILNSLSDDVIGIETVSDTCFYNKNKKDCKP